MSTGSSIETEGRRGKEKRIPAIHAIVLGIDGRRSNTCVSISLLDVSGGHFLLLPRVAPIITRTCSLETRHRHPLEYFTNALKTSGLNKPELGHLDSEAHAILMYVSLIQPSHLQASLPFRCSQRVLISFTVAGIFKAEAEHIYAILSQYGISRQFKTTASSSARDRGSPRCGLADDVKTKQSQEHTSLDSSTNNSSHLDQDDIEVHGSLSSVLGTRKWLESGKRVLSKLGISRYEGSI